ncbi:hypothetical protein CVD28_24410 [Bacillus sp. M6-12]|uniref:hypothetical protein n=1 Tax=Bacillus sp. M6-12 TaxID=2054166 RepID=UPI000C76D70B|nr:hypothetical protein [Bacillus sp. M6-12]PLS15026.1 hypothetical protein CVD28_24410 [Bacillus sp. M6-12]
MLRKVVKNKKGFVSIEAIIAMSSALMVILLAIGFFTLIFPRIMLQTEVHDLAQKAKIQGGLTNSISQPVDSDIEQFKDRLVQLGYDRNSIEVTATTKPGNLNAVGVTPLHDGGSNYIKRDSKEMIQITVRVPANTSIKAPLSFFGDDGSNVADKYTLVETVMSERW